MSPAAKIASLDSRLGVGVGAVRERARLEKELEAEREKRSRDRPSKTKSDSKSKSSGKPKRTSSRRSNRRSKGDRLRGRREVDKESEKWGRPGRGPWGGCRTPGCCRLSCSRRSGSG